ncbi:MAG: Extracellular lipase, Pla/cef family [Myxococcaceae bacterium]|nr:Extracellular lipase, Pla/cef family [Myxococcaceae bacterium]
MKFTGCFALLFLAIGCGGGGVEPAHLSWSEDAQSLENPFPDTRLLTATGAALRADFYRPFMLPRAITGKAKTFFNGYVTAAATELGGFGNFAPVLLRTSAPVDPASLPGSVARLRKTASGYEVLEANVTVEHSTDVLKGTSRTLVSADGGTLDFPEFFLARFGVPLPEGEEGLLVVKKGLKTKSGELFGRGFEWDKAAARPDLQAVAAALSIAPSEVLLALPQKAAGVTAPIKSLAAWVDTAPGLAAVTIPPKGMEVAGNAMRPVGIWKSTEPDWTTIKYWLEKASFGRPATDVAQVVLGEIAARDLREAGVWTAERIADPTRAPVVPLRFVLSIPIGTRPAGGWPTVISAHGLGGRNIPVNGDADSYCLEHAQLLATKGLACLGIDAPSHGVRGNLFDFFEVENLPAIRDKFREMTFDLLQLCRAAPSIDLDGDGQGDLAPELGFLGNSLGGIMGSAFVPIAPRIKYAVLNVPGGGLSNILVSDDIRDRIGLLIISKTGGSFDTLEYYSSFMIFRAVAQPFLEPADPINFASSLPAERAVLVQEGVGDLTIPNFTTENLAAAMKLQVPTAAITGTAPLQVLSREDPAQYLPPDQAKIFNGHNVFGNFAPVRSQAMKFLETKGREYQVP